MCAAGVALCRNISETNVLSHGQTDRRTDDIPRPTLTFDLKMISRIEISLGVANLPTVSKVTDSP